MREGEKESLSVPENLYYNRDEDATMKFECLKYLCCF